MKTLIKYILSMKLCFFWLAFVFWLLSFSSFGQSSDQNYVKSITYKKPSTQGIDPNNPAHVMTEVTYFDGLGRPVQQVAHRQSGEGKDIITHIEYDAYGRQPKEYLPFEANATAMLFDSDAQTHTLSFYNTAYYENTANPYSEKLFEVSPLNRVQEQAAPGNAWSLASGHTIKFGYNTNENGEVKRFYANTTGLEDGAYKATLSMSGHYAPNQLYKTTITDENGIDTDEYKDKEGRVILKRVYNNHWVYDTYYVYDIYGNLTYVIPPNAVDMGTISQTVLDNLCYQYRYDYRNRLVEKRLPGKEIWEYIVYDKLDRVVAAGPALSPFENHLSGEEGWLLTKYDAFGRVAYTGWRQDTSFSSARRSEFQQEMDGETKLYVHKLKTDIITDGVPVRYSNDVFPTTFKLLTVNYYDDYAYPNAPLVSGSVEGQTVTTAVKGLATGSWVRVLTTAMESPVPNEMSYSLYDQKARPIRTHTKNHLDGYTQTDSKLDFTGAMPEYTITRHKRVPIDNEIAVREDFEYTPQSRLQKHSHNINNNLTAEVLSHLLYDKLGQLVTKRTGGSDIAPLQIVDYKYNIRGWLTDINNVESLGNDLFTFKINYTEVFGVSQETYVPLYNGNILETVWRTATDNQMRGYRYNYDDLNRLEEAGYYKYSGNPVIFATKTNSYNEHLSYDQNGNITALTRNGDLDSDTSVIAIDNLIYNYDDMYRLQKVVDFTGNPSGFKEGADNEDEYGYDKYGNMTRDDNKMLNTIRYNHLNLPKEIFFDSGESITYLYNALGQKLQKKVTDNTTTITTDYQSGFHYENYGLKFFATAEGYVNVNGVRFNYVYNYTDHLGNVRLSYTHDRLLGLQVIEENNYYPFGLKHQGYNNISPPYDYYRYKYNGMELQDELGLNVYDFGARNYMPDLGRWANIDPLAEISRRWTPYNYAYNNPVYFIDPDGMQAMSNDFINSGDFDLDYINLKNIKGFDIDKKSRLNKKINLPDSVNYIGGEKNPIDPPKPGEGTNSGFMEGTNSDGSPNGQPINIELDVVTVEFNVNSSSDSESGNTGINPLGPTLVILGQPIKSLKPVGALGSRPGSSIASSSLSKAIPQTFTGTLGKKTGTKVARTIGTNVIGRAIGRFVPVVGWVLLGYDLYNNHGAIQETISSGVNSYLDFQNKGINGETDKNGNPYIFVCFSEGTLVKTLDGLKPIEEIKVGNIVYSYNLEKNKIELSDVKSVFSREVTEIYEVFAKDIIINVTEDHLFYIINKGWMKVKDLNKGDELKLFNEDNKIEISNIQKTNKLVKVYNIEVDDNHNYYVSEIMILVHNKNIIEKK